jgi:hypothetical protein
VAVRRVFDRRHPHPPFLILEGGRYWPLDPFLTFRQVPPSFFNWRGRPWVAVGQDFDLQVSPSFFNFRGRPLAAASFRPSGVPFKSEREGWLGRFSTFRWVGDPHPPFLILEGGHTQRLWRVFDLQAGRHPLPSFLNSRGRP